jgi:hypothetical protein
MLVSPGFVQRGHVKAVTMAISIGAIWLLDKDAIKHHFVAIRQAA